MFSRPLLRSTACVNASRVGCATAPLLRRGQQTAALLPFRRALFTGLTRATKPRPAAGGATKRWLSGSAPAPLLALWKSYSALLEKHPIPVKALTSGFICGLGDLVCQLGMEDHIDGGRLLRFAFMGTFVLAPTLHVWYVAFPPHTSAAVAGGAE